MKFTFNWLKTHLKTDTSYLKIADVLTNIGLEVEDVKNLQQIYADFIVAQIDLVEKHPNADKLNLCTVNDGKEQHKIVCGAPNVEVGMKVVLAPVGSTIPKNNFMIKKAVIRGIESNGMLCSSDELNLGEEADGIIKLPNSARVGEKFVNFQGLNDIIYDVAITPNRGDCNSVYGIARDLAAAKLGKLNNYEDYTSLAFSDNLPFDVRLEDKEGCQLISLYYIKGVKNNFKSPDKIKNLLNLVDVKSNGPLVDISNFAMYEYGRPNHIYDADKIKGTLIIRKSKQGESFIPIGKDEITLDSGITVITDDEKILAVAGVIGGELSKVDEDTSNILVEVANFNPNLVRKAGSQLNIITDSRFRFERRIDFGNKVFFSTYLIQSILKYCGGNVVGGKDFYGSKINYLTDIKFDLKDVEKIIGTAIPKKESNEILKALGFRYNDNEITIPSWRQGDVQGTADIAEEILRIYGIEKVLPKPFKLSSDKTILRSRCAEDLCRDLLSKRGLDEVVTWSFISKELSKVFHAENEIALDNAISSEREVMKSSVIPPLLEVVKKNITRGHNNLAFFEICNIYSKDYTDMQKKCFAGIRAGNALEKSIYAKERKFDFYDVKDDILAFIAEFYRFEKNIKVDRKTPKYYHPTKSAAFYIRKKLIGYGGELHPSILQNMKINTNVLSFEIFIDEIPITDISDRGDLKIFDYQPVIRDFAFVIDENILSDEIINSVTSLNLDILEDVKIFDLFQDEELGKHKKSIAISVKLQPKKHTLSDAEIDKISNLIISNVKKNTNGKLRK